MANGSGRSLGDLIRDARVEHKITLRSLAERFGKSPSYISDIENDRRIPAEPFLREICTVLSLDFDDAMALAGRLGHDAERELRRTPELGLLFRKLSDLPTRDRNATIRKYLGEVEEKLKG